MDFIIDNLRFYDNNGILLNPDIYLKEYDIDVLSYIEDVVKSEDYPDIINDWLTINQIIMIENRNFFGIEIIDYTFKKCLRLILDSKLSRLINKFNLEYACYISIL